MKKPTKPNTSKSQTGTSRTSTRSRHTKSAKKPVTIDLKAEKVEKAVKTEPAETAKTAAVTKGSEISTAKKVKADKPTAEKSKPKTSVPKSTKSSNSLDAIANKENGDPTATSKPKEGDAKSSASDTPKKTEQPVNKKPVTTNTQKPGSSGKIAAGLIGGIIALGGATALQYTGVLPNPSSNERSEAAALTQMRSDMETRIAELENKLAASQSQAPAIPDLSGIDKRMAELENKVSTEAISASSLEATKELQGQVEQTNTNVAALKDQLTTTAKTVEELKTAVSGGAAGDDAAVTALTSQLETISASVAALSVQVESLEQKPVQEASPEVATALEALKTSIPALEAQLSNKISSVETTIAESTAKFPKIDESIGALKNGATQIEEKLARIEKGLSDQSALLTTVQSSAEAGKKRELAAAQAIAAAALKSEIDQGLPFKESLARLQSLAPENAELAKLASLTENAVPTVSQLTSEFNKVGEKILTALTGPEDSSISARLLAGAKSLVKVKPLKPQEGTTPTALVSQIEGALKSGDLAAADTVWKTLPKAGQAASMDWHDKLVARTTANTIIAETVQSFVLTNVSQ